jgi:hypothetical protein
MKSKQLNAALAATVTFAFVILSAYGAKAGFITQADFDSSAVVSDLNNLGPAPDVFVTPFTLGIYTFTTDNGILGYYATQGLNNSRALGTTAEDLGWIRIEIAPSAQITKFGFFVGGNSGEHNQVLAPLPPKGTGPDMKRDHSLE